MSVGWMPWRCVPKKDVAELRKAWGSRERAVIPRSPNGATQPAQAGYRPECIFGRRAPGELKHLSTPRRRKYSRSSGERTGRCLNRIRAKLAGLADTGL
jgi:hypothetical protein